jgi:hypothetical protein
MMPRFLSDMFDDGTTANDVGGTGPATDAGQGETGSLAGDINTDLDLTVAVHADVGVAWDDGESSGNWSHSSDIVLTTSTDVLLGAIVEGDNVTEQGDGN